METTHDLLFHIFLIRYVCVETQSPLQIKLFRVRPNGLLAKDIYWLFPFKREVLIVSPKATSEQQVRVLVRIPLIWQVFCKKHIYVSWTMINK